MFIRVGRHEANLRHAIEAVRAGATEAGRNPDEVKIAIILHTILTDAPSVARQVEDVAREVDRAEQVGGDDLVEHLDRDLVDPPVGHHPRAADDRGGAADADAADQLGANGAGQVPRLLRRGIAEHEARFRETTAARKMAQQRPSGHDDDEDRE